MLEFEFKYNCILRSYLLMIYQVTTHLLEAEYQLAK